ncbi:MAG: type II toxin-antitoxin system prevent-host-death family antitoxin [Thermomicrobiales bacterium]
MATRPFAPRAAARTITLAEAATQFDTVVDAVSAGEGDVILERDGTPKVAVISIEEYRDMVALREQEQQREARRAKALRWLREFQESYDGRNDDLSEEDSMDLAVRATREVRAELWEERQERLRKSGNAEASAK